MKGSFDKSWVLALPVLAVLTAVPSWADFPPQFVGSWGSPGSGNGQFNAPCGVAIGPDRHIYVVDGFNYRIQIFDTSGVYVGQWGTAGSGPGQFALGAKGVAISPSGTVYIADTENHRIQVFDAAGNFLNQWGAQGSGTGQFNEPYGVALDAHGNVYVADRDNNRVQKFDAEGNYLTQWGGLIGPLDVAASTNGYVFVVDPGNSRIVKYDTTGTYVKQWGSDGFADGRFSSPNGVGVDESGHVYVSDSGNQRIQKFDANGNYLTQWGGPGTGDGQFNWPVRSLAISNGNVYVTDFFNARIEEFGPSINCDPPTITSNPQDLIAPLCGRATFRVAASGASPTFQWRKNGVYIGGATDSTYILASLASSDAAQYDVVVSDSCGAVTSASASLTIAGVAYPAIAANPQSQTVLFGSSATFTVSATNALTYQWRKSRVRISGATGSTYFIPATTAADVGYYDVIVSDSCGVDSSAFAFLGVSALQFEGKWGSNGADAGQFANSPEGVAVDVTGNIYVADTPNHRIQKFAPDSTFLLKWGTFGSGNGQFSSPRAVAVGPDGSIYVADTNNSRIQKFAPDSTFLMEWGTTGGGDGQFRAPFGVAVDAGGSIYVADTNNSRIQKFASDSTFLMKWGKLGSGNGQFNHPMSLCVDASGDVYVTDPGNRRVEKFAPDSTFLLKWGTPGSGGGQFSNPRGITLDASGNVYVVDSGNNRVQGFAPDSTFLTQWGTLGSGDGQFSSPWGIAVDTGGNVLVGDAGNSRMQKFGWSTMTGAPVNVVRPTVRLAPPVPNPWAGKTTLGFTLAHEARVSVSIYSVQGRLLKRWTWPSLAAGPHQVVWNGRTDYGREASTGVLFLRLDVGGQVLTGKMVHLR